MRELDNWVTGYEDATWCSVKSYHVYKCVPNNLFEGLSWSIGMCLMLDGSSYKICSIWATDAAPGEKWHIVYAHLAPKSLSKEEWCDVYTPKVKAS